MATPTFKPKDEPKITEIHRDFIVYLLEIKEVSPRLYRASEIIVTSTVTAKVAEELIDTLKGLRMKGAGAPVRQTYGMRSNQSGVKFI